MKRTLRLSGQALLEGKTRVDLFEDGDLWLYEGTLSTERGLVSARGKYSFRGFVFDVEASILPSTSELETLDDLLSVEWVDLQLYIGALQDIPDGEPEEILQLAEEVQKELSLDSDFLDQVRTKLGSRCWIKAKEGEHIEVTCPFCGTVCRCERDDENFVVTFSCEHLTGEWDYDPDLEFAFEA